MRPIDRMFVALLAGALLTMLPCQLPAAPEASAFAIGDTDFLLDGKPFLIRCGEMHFARIPREYWQHRLRMARAMGLNTVCAYLFWNYHEPQPGTFNFRGSADAAEFCRLAQAEGLKVILRPGPYSCAEWDFGGLPYWLLKIPDIKMRTQDARYLEGCQRYLRAVGRQLAPLQVTRGGPIIMVQVENEYGSYGNDKEYIGIIRDYLVQAGFEVPLFTCDGPSQLKNDTRQELFSVVNFGGDPESNFKALRQIRPQGPLMCGEYYPGWFDSWGKPHHTGSSANVVKELGWMLEHDASFSIYMVHGGTSFGFTAGANCPPFSPQATSYDYDAPISEAGWDTPKFHALRELFLKHLAPGEVLPSVPPRYPVIQIPSLKLIEYSPLLTSRRPVTKLERPEPLELLDQGHGLALYRTRVTLPQPALLKITELHDYGLVFLEGKKIATLDRRRNQNSIQLPAQGPVPVTLDLLIDTFGHVNYGGYIHDRKGITEKVELTSDSGSRELTGWEVRQFSLDSKDLSRLRFQKGQTKEPAFYRASFQVPAIGDTFLDLRSWGKGMVWVNGHNLGRFWNIGPQQTLYCPGAFLRKGRNELIVFELNGATACQVAGLPEPILNQVGEEAAIRKNRRPGQAVNLSGIQPLASGSFAPGKEAQVVKLPPTRAQYICLEALDSQNSDPFTTCAELDLLGTDGKDLSRQQWRVAFADSEETDGDDGKADNVFDLQTTTVWHTEWEASQPPHPHQLVLDLGSEQTVTGLRYLPRQDSVNGRIKRYRVYLSETPFPGLGQPSN
jgi:beta-galactosidase